MEIRVPRIIIATNNRDKLAEIRSILGANRIEICSAADYPDFPEIEETGETLAENASRTQDAYQLTSLVRVALGPAIVQQFYPSAQELQVIGMDKDLEYVLMQAMQSSQNGIGIEPGLADTVLRGTRTAAEIQEQLGLPAVMLVPTQLRDLLARFLRRAVPGIRVISHDEVPDFKTIRVTAMVGGKA